MHLRILLILLASCLTGSVSAAGNDNIFTLYLVRHAEKQSDGGRDPGLTTAGMDRARKLADRLQNKDIVDIWSSDYKRTRSTAEPLLEELNLDLKIYDPGNLPALAEQLRDNSSNAYVVGHSNTTPELARLLCQCVIADMDESEYERLIVITVVGEEVRVQALRQN
jgi:phosphohistidine phosphatase SixA